MDNSKLLKLLLSPAKIASIDGITEPSTKISSIDELHNLKATTKFNTTMNPAMTIPLTIEMKYLNIEQGENTIHLIWT